MHRRASHASTRLVLPLLFLCSFFSFVTLVDGAVGESQEERERPNFHPQQSRHNSKGFAVLFNRIFSCAFRSRSPVRCDSASNIILAARLILGGAEAMEPESHAPLSSSTPGASCRCVAPSATAAAAAAASTTATHQKGYDTVGDDAARLSASHTTRSTSSPSTSVRKRAQRSFSPLPARSPATAYLSLRSLLEEVEQQQAHLRAAGTSHPFVSSGVVDEDVHDASRLYTSESSCAASVPDASEGAGSSVSSTPAATRRRTSPSSAVAARALRRLLFLAQWTQHLLEAYPLVDDSDAECVASPTASPVDDVFASTVKPAGNEESAGAAVESINSKLPLSLLTTAVAASTTATATTAVPRDVQHADAPAVHSPGKSSAHGTDSRNAAEAVERPLDSIAAQTGALLHLITLPSTTATTASTADSFFGGGGDGAQYARTKEKVSDSATKGVPDAAERRSLHDRSTDTRRPATAASSSLGSPPPPPVVPRDRQPLRCDVGPAYDPPQTPAEERAVLMAQGCACAHCGAALPLPRGGGVFGPCCNALSRCFCCCCCCCGGGGDDSGSGGDADSEGEEEDFLASVSDALLTSQQHQQQRVASNRVNDTTESEARRSPTPANVVRRLRLTSSLSSHTAAAAALPADVLAGMTAAMPTALITATPVRPQDAAADGNNLLFCAYEGRYLCPGCFDAPLSHGSGQIPDEALEWQTRPLSLRDDGSESAQGLSPVRVAVSQAAGRVHRWWEARQAVEEAAPAALAAAAAQQRAPNRQPSLLMPTRAQRTAAVAMRARCVLPSHVLLRWDFNRYAVSAAAATMLRRLEAPSTAAAAAPPATATATAAAAERRTSLMEGWADAAAAATRTQWMLPALYDISRVNPALYRHVAALATASQLRKRLCLVHAQAWWCPRYRAEVWGKHTPVSSAKFDVRRGASPVRGTNATSRVVEVGGCNSGSDDGDDEAKAAEGREESRWRSSSPLPPRCVPRRRYLVERAEGWSLLDLYRLTTFSHTTSRSPRTLSLLAELQAMQAVLEEHVSECAYCRMRRPASSEGH